MKISKTLLVLCGSVGTIAGIAGLAVSLQSEPIVCVEELRQRSENLGQKMVVGNEDGGLVLLSQGTGKNVIIFHGYFGPRTAENLKERLANGGMSNIVVSIQQTCETQGGLVYTLVSGSYSVPEPQVDPDPI